MNEPVASWPPVGLDNTPSSKQRLREAAPCPGHTPACWDFQRDWSWGTLTLVHRTPRLPALSLALTRIVYWRPFRSLPLRPARSRIVN